MSDAIEDYMARKSIRKKVRDYFGVKCRFCLARVPKAHPTILLPGQVCRVCGCKDGRPDLTIDDYARIGIVLKNEVKP